MSTRLHFMKSPWPTKLAFVVLLIFLFTAIAAPLIAPFGLNDTVGDPWEGMSATHVFGTDSIGRDILSRLIFGARITFVVAGSATALAFLLGITLGFIAATGAPWLNSCLSRLNDLLMSIPTLILALVLLAIVPINLTSLILVMAVLDSTRVFRLAKALASDIVVLEFVEAARLRGESDLWILLREVLPNTLAPLITEFALRFAFAILFLSALSFLGLGVQPPYADWGSLVRENKDGIIFGVPAALIPGIAIAVLTFSVNALADRFVNVFSSFRKDQ